MTTPRPLIGRGVRAPDFALPRREGGGPVRFYGQVGGRPVVLLFAGDHPTIALEVAHQLATTEAEHLDVFVLTCGSDLVATTDRGAADEATPAGADGFHDAGGRLHMAYGIPADTPHAVVLDANVRVVATVAIDDLDAAVAAIGAAVPPAPTDDGVPAPRIAPVLYVPDAITPQLRDRLIELWETGGSVETGVETVVDGQRAEATDVRRKRRRDHVVTDPQLLRELTQHLGSRVFPELQKAFAFAAGGFEGFKIACYRAEDRGHFEAHRDNLSSLTAHRRFGFSCNLNDGYTGGELRFGEYGPTRHRPADREALLFSGSHLHEVLPVTEGQRFVLLSFILAKGGSTAAR